MAADQLQTAASAVQKRLKTLPAPTTASEKVVARTAADFAKESQAFRRHLARWLVDKRPARTSLTRLNKLAWTMHRHLDRAPRYRPIWRNWARTVSTLRRVNRALASPP